MADLKGPPDLNMHESPDLDTSLPESPTIQRSERKFSVNGIKKMFNKNILVRKISSDSGCSDGDECLDSSMEGKCSPDEVTRKISDISLSCVNKMQATIETDEMYDNLGTDNLTEGVVVKLDEENVQTPEYFRVDLEIVSGIYLVPMDYGGTSDPYVKVLLDNKIIQKTRSKNKTLAPQWNEKFTIYIENKNTPLVLQVYDKDFMKPDDFMGQAELNLETCHLDEINEIHLHLQDGGDKYLRGLTNNTLGSILVKVSVSSMSKQQYLGSLRNKTILKDQKGKKMRNRQFRNAIVHVNLLQGNNSDPFCKLTLDKETYKTKKSNILYPKCNEAFDFFWAVDGVQELCLKLYDKDTFKRNDYLGKVSVNLAELEPEISHNIKKCLKDGSREINLVVTISGITSPMHSFFRQPESPNENLEEQYSWKNTLDNIEDVGHLFIKVIKADGLHPADLFGKSDPYCVLELENARLQTHTEYQTLKPEWGKNFKFKITDINEILEVTVYDEDSNHQKEFLGNVSFSLENIQNGKYWYNLKDKNLINKANGKDPKILLERNVQWNLLRASVQALELPKVKKQEPEESLGFRKMCTAIAQNGKRVKAAFPVLDFSQFERILNWENWWKSTVIYIGVVLGIWFFNLWMVTFGLLIPFIKHLVNTIFSNKETPSEESGEDSPEEEETDEVKSSEDSGEDCGDTDEESCKKNWKETVRMIKPVLRTIDDYVEFLAHILESINNVFNFSAPLLSWLGFIFVAIITGVLYFIPLRVLMILLVTKVFMLPSDVNELANFISKVPDNRQFLQRQNDKVQESIPSSDSENLTSPAL